MATYIQSSFVGGLNQLLDPTKINNNQYALLINGRCRKDVIEPIRKTTAIDIGLPAEGLNQGLYAARNYLILFKGGQAYVRDYSIPGSSFNLVAGLLMDPTVPVIYAELVPTSTSNLVRKTIDDTKVQQGVNLSSATAASPQAILVQDGLSQPWIIDSNLSARITQNFNQWNAPDGREYVPIMKQMLYSGDGILYGVSADGSKIYRSVTGRPLDFVVAVDSNGNKLTEAAGDANALSHAVDFDTIVALRATGLQDGSIYVSTLRNSYLVVPDFNDTIYDEPQFSNVFLFPTGALNQFSFVDILGDSAMITLNSIHSYNAVLQTKNTGRSTPFSAIVQSLFTGIVQDITAAGSFDNYAVFAVNTIYGYGVVWYDKISKTFVSLDLYANVNEPIKQIATVETDSDQLLFFLTDSDVFQAQASTTEFETCGALIGEWCSGDPKNELDINYLKCVFSNVKESGTVYATLLVDRQQIVRINKSIIQEPTIVDSMPITPPFGGDTRDRVKNLTFDFSAYGGQGWKAGFFIQWNFDAVLSHIQAVTNDNVSQNALEQQASEEAAAVDGVPITESFTPSSGVPTTVVTITGVNFAGVTAVKFGTVDASSFTVTNDNTIVAVVPATLPVGVYTLNLEKNSVIAPSESTFTVTT